jgi:hypothetical protein
MSPEDDPFLDSTMQVDTPPPSTPLKVSMPDKTLQRMYKQLEDEIQPGFDNDDEDAQEVLDYVWIVIHHTLSKLLKDQMLGTHLADLAEFRENLKKAGKKKFINLLKDIAKRKSWWELLKNSTSFVLFDLKQSDCILSPDLFFMHDHPVPPRPMWGLSNASKAGAQ